MIRIRVVKAYELAVAGAAILLAAALIGLLVTAFSGGGAVETSAPDFSSFVFSANVSEPTDEDAQTLDAVSDPSERAAQVAEYVETLKNVALDGERVELRALSEISPTFSASETTEGALEVAPEANVVDVEAFEADEDDEDEDGEGDAIESLDYDEWATVFLADSEARDADADSKEAESETGDESFLDYFDEVDEDEEDWEDEEEYGDEEEFDDDADDEGEDLDETDDFDEIDDE